MPCLHEFLVLIDATLRVREESQPSRPRTNALRSSPVTTTSSITLSPRTRHVYPGSLSRAATRHEQNPPSLNPHRSDLPLPPFLHNPNPALPSHLPHPPSRLPPPGRAPAPKTRSLHLHARRRLGFQRRRTHPRFLPLPAATPTPIAAFCQHAARSRSAIYTSSREFGIGARDPEFRFCA